jgi:hypothetical protein
MKNNKVRNTKVLDCKQFEVFIKQNTCSILYTIRLLPLLKFEELDGPTVSALGVGSRKISTVCKGWSSDWWPKILSWAPPCVRRNIKALVSAAFAVVSIHSTINLHWACMLGYGPFVVCVIFKKDLCFISGDINTLMMIKIFSLLKLNCAFIIMSYQLSLQLYPQTNRFK